MTMNPFQFETVFDRWQSYLTEVENHKPSTVVEKLRNVRFVYRQLNGDLLLEPNYWKIHESIIETGNRNGWQRNTVYRCFCHVKLFFDWANLTGITSNHPIRVFHYKKAGKKEAYCLRPEQSRKLWMNPFLSPRDQAVLMLFEATGVRRGELQQLRIGDCDFRPGRRHVHIKNGKRDGFRWVPVSREYASYFRIYLRYLKQAGFEKPDDPLFPNESTGRGIGLSRINKLLVRLGRKHRIKAHPHAMRHGYATDKLEKGLNLKILQTCLGHANLNQTAEYLHVTPEHSRKEIDRLT